MEVKSNFISLVHIKLLYTSTIVTLYALVHIKLLYTSIIVTLYALVRIKLLYTSIISLFISKHKTAYTSTLQETKFLRNFLLIEVNRDFLDNFLARA